MVRGLVLSIVLLIVAGCVSSGPSIITDPRQVWCDASEPRRDATPETPRNEIDEINAHNRKGALWCGWKAAR